MISVCMATKNGAPYLREQLDSILEQLALGDELIISDDSSTDNTIAVIQSYRDDRIKLIQNHFPKGITRNFEAALLASKGDLIFLADQDDVWVKNKINIMIDHLAHFDLVISDCLLTDHSLNSKNHSFFKINNSGKGLLKNIFKNSYIGCCMAFNRTLLNQALPFPKDIPMHDSWIGLVAELNFRIHFIPDILILHRRHFTNASTTGVVSRQNLSQKFTNRYRIIKNLILRKSYA